MGPDFVVTQRGFTRRDFLKGGGALVVSFAVPGCATLAGPDTAAAEFPRPGTAWPAKVDPALLDSWLRIASDGSVSASVGKIEAGMGVGTSFAQIVAEELDVPLERVTIVMGDTATTVNQRGTGSSNGVMKGGEALRKAGAQARSTLLALASSRLGVPAADLRVDEGIVYASAQPSKRVSYGELLGDRQFHVKVEKDPRCKDPKEYRIVGRPVARMDIAPKMRAEYRYAADLRVPGMLHGRVIRPPEAHARLLHVDEDASLPGLVRVVRKGDFVGVVCEREEQAIEAARRLRVEWSRPGPLYWASYDALYEHLRTGRPKVSKSEDVHGDVEAALAAAASRVEARYEYPFQSHASMGPACAVADVRDGGAIVWAGGQKPYPLRGAVAQLLGLPAGKVRVIWMPGPGSYGMNDADDCAMDAALLSHAVGRPVRLQYMRADGTGWDPKGPPAAFHLRAGLDGEGNVTAWDYDARGFSGQLRRSGTDVPGQSLAGQLIGGYPAESHDEHKFSDESYAFPAKRKASHILPWDQSLGTALRTAHLRDPDGPSTCFASESFVDEVAYAAQVDPVEFRLRYLKQAREKAVVRAAAQKAQWRPRTKPRRAKEGGLLVGQGLSYAPRHGTVVAIVAEVAVDPSSGRYRVRRFTVAHDCGFVVNPRSLAGTIEANLMQAMSRAMHEAVRFDPTRVLSVDWITYPVVDMMEVPDAVDIVMLGNEPGAKIYGAGEPSTRPVAAAIANALHDAIGAPVRRVPLTHESVLAAMRG
jgi:CO/xanthine dehydrogenase Mo-binding subunit